MLPYAVTHVRRPVRLVDVELCTPSRGCDVPHSAQIDRAGRATATRSSGPAARHQDLGHLTGERAGGRHEVGPVAAQGQATGGERAPVLAPVALDVGPRQMTA